MKQLPSRLLRRATMTVENTLGESSFGTVYGEKVDIPIRLVKKQKVSTFPTGSIILYDLIVYTNVCYVFTDKAKVTVEDITYSITDIQPQDEVYQKLLLKKIQ